MNFKNMSNDEINIELKKLENEYEMLKLKAFDIVEKMKELDTLYVKCRKELINRSKGVF